MATQNFISTMLGWAEARQEMVRQIEDLRETGELFSRRLLFRIPEMAPLGWLSHQPSRQRFYWKGHSGREIAAVGVAWEADSDTTDEASELWSSARQVLSDIPEASLWIGMAFPKTLSGKEWRSFHAARMILPRIEVIRDTEACYLVCNLLSGSGEHLPVDHILDELKNIVFTENIREQEPSCISRRDEPAYEQWARNVQLALSAVSSATAQRIVLARRRTLVFDPAPDPVALLKGFSSDISSGIDFLFQCGGSAAFFGSATEDLFERDGRSLSARTLAATFRESEVESMDRRVSFTALLNSFRHHCVSYEVKEPKLADRTQKPEHVRLTGRVAEGVTDEDLLNSFHPSPLMSGVPIDDACRLIDQWEDFDRGWFGGAVGLIGADKTEIGVADKAFLMEGNRVYAYRASGIVAGADPRRTWERLGP